MKIAVFFSGRITGWKNCINTLKTKFTDVYDTDVFLSLDLKEEDDEVREFKNTFIVVNCYYEQYIKFLKDIPYKSEETSERKSLSMFYHNLSAIKMILAHIKKTDVKYDVIVKFRADISSNDTFLIHHNVTANTVYFPYGFCYRGINDQIGYGDLNSMVIYCGVYNHIPKYVYIDKAIFNPEFLLMYHLNFNNFNIIRFPYNYILHPDRFKNDVEMNNIPIIKKISLLELESQFNN